MNRFSGKTVSKGIQIGPVFVLKGRESQVKRSRITDAEAEIERVEHAVKKAQEQLQGLYDKAVKEVGEASAAIFEVHQMMLEDEDYLEARKNVFGERKDKFVCLMDLALMAMRKLKKEGKLDNQEKSDEINA